MSAETDCEQAKTVKSVFTGVTTSLHVIWHRQCKAVFEPLDSYMNECVWLASLYSKSARIQNWELRDRTYGDAHIIHSLRQPLSDIVVSCPKSETVQAIHLIDQRAGYCGILYRPSVFWQITVQCRSITNDNSPLIIIAIAPKFSRVHNEIYICQLSVVYRCINILKSGMLSQNWTHFSVFVTASQYNVRCTDTDICDTFCW